MMKIKCMFLALALGFICGPAIAQNADPLIGIWLTMEAKNVELPGHVVACNSRNAAVADDCRSAYAIIKVNGEYWLKMTANLATEPNLRWLQMTDRTTENGNEPLLQKTVMLHNNVVHLVCIELAVARPKIKVVDYNNQDCENEDHQGIIH